MTTEQKTQLMSERLSAIGYLGDQIDGSHIQTIVDGQLATIDLDANRIELNGQLYSFESMREAFQFIANR